MDTNPKTIKAGFASRRELSVWSSAFTRSGPPEGGTPNPRVCAGFAEPNLQTVGNHGFVGSVKVNQSKDLWRVESLIC